MRAPQHAYCTECRQIVSKEPIHLMEGSSSFELNAYSSHFLFKLEIWDYDSCRKVAETHIFAADVPKAKNTLEQTISDYDHNTVHLSLSYKYETLTLYSPRKPQSSTSIQQPINKITNLFNSSTKNIKREKSTYHDNDVYELRERSKFPLWKQNIEPYKLKL